MCWCPSLHRMERCLFHFSFSSGERPIWICASLVIEMNVRIGFSTLFVPHVCFVFHLSRWMFETRVGCARRRCYRCRVFLLQFVVVDEVACIGFCIAIDWLYCYFFAPQVYIIVGCRYLLYWIGGRYVSLLRLVSVSHSSFFELDVWKRALLRTKPLPAKLLRSVSDGAEDQCASSSVCLSLHWQPFIRLYWRFSCCARVRSFSQDLFDALFRERSHLSFAFASIFLRASYSVPHDSCYRVAQFAGRQVKLTVSNRLKQAINRLWPCVAFSSWTDYVSPTLGGYAIDRHLLCLLTRAFPFRNYRPIPVCVLLLSITPFMLLRSIGVHEDCTLLLHRLFVYSARSFLVSFAFVSSWMLESVRCFEQRPCRRSSSDRLLYFVALTLLFFICTAGVVNIGSWPVARVM